MAGTRNSGTGTTCGGYSSSSPRASGTDQLDRERQQKRGGGRTVGESAMPARAEGEQAGQLDQIIGREPTEFAALVAEEFQHLLNGLEDESLRSIAIWKMEGYTNAEIAERLGRSLRTVANKLKLIRMIWECDPISEGPEGGHPDAGSLGPPQAAALGGVPRHASSRPYLRRI